MGKRREGREAAVQFLFQRDLNPVETSELDGDFWHLRPATEKTRAFAADLIAGVIANQGMIDEQITKYATNYQLHRIAATDRNILRVAIFEMLFSKEVPPVVSINEAIEIAKAYGSEESGRFVNGILDRVRHDLDRPAREAVPNPKSEI